MAALPTGVSVIRYEGIKSPLVTAESQWILMDVVRVLNEESIKTDRHRMVFSVKLEPIAMHGRDVHAWQVTLTVERYDSITNEADDAKYKARVQWFECESNYRLRGNRYGHEKVFTPDVKQVIK